MGALILRRKLLRIWYQTLNMLVASGASWGILCFGVYENASKAVCACRFAASCIITVEALGTNHIPCRPS